MTLIPSGINYVGNKWRMLPTLIDNLDLSRKTFVDVFCGSGVVGINVPVDGSATERGLVSSFVIIFPLSNVYLEFEWNILQFLPSARP